MTAKNQSVEPTWAPDNHRIINANITRFQQYLTDYYSLSANNYGELHRWSIERKDLFWPAVANFCNLSFDTPLSPSGVPKGNIFPRKAWFPNSKINFAQALLSRNDSFPAIISHLEDGTREEISYAALNRNVSIIAQFLRDNGVMPGDRVAGYLPNVIPTVVAMLATASIGAIWSSCSPDFGAHAVIDRFGQIEPKILFAVSSYQYGGKIHDISSRLSEIIAKLPSVSATVICNHALDNNFNQLINYYELIASKTETKELIFEKFPFDHPLYILYSSGTTGKPKCIVHGAGGTLLQHVKELALHSDLKAEETIFYFTTCGWMMWNWLVSSLALKATVVIYDGAPLFPVAERLFNIVEAEKVAILGISAKYLSALEKSGIKPQQLLSLNSLQTILSTGSPLLLEQYDFVYKHIKSDLCLSSISGGTDIVSCFALGNPTLPVHKGKLQCLGLGMDVDIFNDDGEAISKTPGELVCKSSFPSMPIYFWNDPNNNKYRSSYFERFTNVWCHGDWAEIDDLKQLTIHGRSDATLNPGGVRIGTAEIYRAVEKFDEIIEALAIGQSWKGDIRIVLFVKMQPPAELTSEIIEKLKAEIKLQCSPRHVPAKIISIPEIPRTISGKIVELAVKNIVEGRPINNREALANPQALDYFANIQTLLED